MARSSSIRSLAQLSNERPNAADPSPSFSDVNFAIILPSIRDRARVGIPFPMTEERPSLWPEIANENLKASNIPSATAPWDQIRRFAGSFNAYAAAEVDRYKQLDFQTRRDFLCGKKLALDDLGLSELRGILFLSWRALRHVYCGGKPSPEEMAYILALIEAIRRKVRGGSGQ